MSKYLDVWELAEELAISQATLVRRLKRESWLLPPLAHLGMPGLLRWRAEDVRSWRVEMELMAASTLPPGNASSVTQMHDDKGTTAQFAINAN